MADLQQTKNTFKVVGRVTRLDKDGAYKEEQMTKGKRQGDVYRSLRFGVKTSATNEITVSMFDYEPDKVFLWNSDKRKEDPSYKGETVSFYEWEERKDELKEQGYAVLQTRVGLTHGDDGKIKSEGLPSYVASEHIFENLRNGDSVAVEGEIRYSRYTNQKGEEKEQTTYTIKKIFKLYEEIDFEAEDFEEITYFEQDLVFVEADTDKELGKVYVTGRTIDYKGNFFDSQFIVNYKDAEGKNDPDMVKLAGAFTKVFKFGDVLKVFGQTVNRVVLREVEAEDENETDLFAAYGGKKKPKHAEKFAARDYISEMSIEGVEEFDQGVYTEDDFVKDELLEEESEKKSEFGGKDKKNPFDKKVDEDPFSDGSSPIEISDDDLPF
jgi:single-stranded DNA-binding protein